jgi:hypothetical protein
VSDDDDRGISEIRMAGWTATIQDATWLACLLAVSFIPLKGTHCADGECFIETVQGIEYKRYTPPKR